MVIDNISIYAIVKLYIVKGLLGIAFAFGLILLGGILALILVGGCYFWEYSIELKNWIKRKFKK